MPCVATGCVDGQCVGGCAPGDVSCDDVGVRVCNAQGQWSAGEPCPGQACVEGHCVGECEPGTTRCVAGQVSSCGDDGVWNAATPCPGTEAVCLGSACTTCGNGQVACGDHCADLQSATSDCGSCGTSCDTPPNAAAWCASDAGATPACGFTCTAPFLDCDPLLAGCETDGTSAEHCGQCGNVCSRFERCEPSGCACDPTYVPPADGGVFVDALLGDDDAGLGLPASPFKTIGRAMQAAARRNLPNVYVAVGTYPGGLAFIDADAGLYVRGGFESGSFTQSCSDAGSVSTVITGTGVVVAARGLTHPSGLSRTSVIGTPSSAGSIGVLVTGDGGVFSLEDVHVRAARGADGSPGSPGFDGQTTTCVTSNPGDGGIGARGTDGVPRIGTFGPNGYAPEVGANGTSGGPGRAGSLGGSLCQGVSTCTGAGCGVHGTIGTTSVCSGNGRAGCGGAPGTQGNGATGGHASVGVYVAGAGMRLTVSGGLVEAASGGKGGLAGHGGQGGSGGDGEVSCVRTSPVYESLTGGCGVFVHVDQYACVTSQTTVEICGTRGTNGGTGGAGGSGAHGSGGPSAAVVIVGGAQVTLDAVELHAADGGSSYGPFQGPAAPVLTVP